MKATCIPTVRVKLVVISDYEVRSSFLRFTVKCDIIS